MHVFPEIVPKSYRINHIRPKTWGVRFLTGKLLTRFVHNAATRFVHNAATRFVHNAATRFVHNAATRFVHNAATRFVHNAATRFMVLLQLLSVSK